MQPSHGAYDEEGLLFPSDASLVWSDARLLGFGPMDKTHQEFYEVAFKLYTCTPPTALEAICRFEQHAKSHFSEEEDWMHSANFPASDCHLQEHAAVLDSVSAVKAAVVAGRAGELTVKQLAVSLFEWFPAHADYMDSALAAWMVKLQYGGRPVVLRRNR